MLNAISRYGARVIPNTQQIAADLEQRGLLIEGPQIAQFDVCTRLDLFNSTQPSRRADRGAEAVQLPVYESLTDEQIERVAQVVVESVLPVSPTGMTTIAPEVGPSRS